MILNVELIEQDTNIEADFNEEISVSNVDAEAIYASGFEDGKNRFWNALQNNGNGANYHYAFCYNRFNDDNFEPIHPINCSTGNSTSMAIFFANTVITDTKVPIYLSNNAQSCFYGCTALKTIRELGMNTQTKFDYTFFNCTALENITITKDKYIAQSIDFSECPLTKASISNVVNALMSAYTMSTTITFKRAAVNKAFETSAGANDGSTSAEWNNLISYKVSRGWTVSLV